MLALPGFMASSQIRKRTATLSMRPIRTPCDNRDHFVHTNATAR